MPWYRISLTADQVAAGTADMLEEQFEQVWDTVGRPADMTLFATRGAGNGGSSRVYYLSPAAMPYAAPLVTAYGGMQTDPPDTSAARIAAGGHGPHGGLR